MLTLLALVPVPSCAPLVAGPGYGGLVAVRADVGAMRFLLRLKPDRAEVVRISPMFPPDFEEVAARAQLAVARETGCRPAWTVGDPSMLEIGLSCAGARPPRKPNRRGTACTYLEAAGRQSC